MEILWCILALIFSICFIQRCFQKQEKKLPPGPPGLPILGHLHILKSKTAKGLESISKQYGPIIFLQYGARPTLVVSSPSIVEECFTKKDIIFTNRPDFEVARDKTLKSTMSLSPYGDYWRNLRRVGTIHFFSSARIGRFSDVRAEEMRLLVINLFSNSTKTCKVNLNSLFKELTTNVLLKMISGRRYYGPDSFFSGDLPTTIYDYLPILKWIGFGRSFRMENENFNRERDKFLQHMIDDCRKSEVTSYQSMTLIQAVLSLQKVEPENYPDNVIKAMIMDVLAGGPETSAFTMEWVMSLLLNHPEVMQKLRAEIDDNVPSSRLVQDSDLSKLPYLRCVVKETQRLLPVAPLLLPRCSSEDCTVGGYHVPKGTTLLVNVWALHRDPKVWEEPTEFKPERFEGFKDADEGYKFLPFGKGRRVCPGAAMALQLICLTLGTLIQCFDWERIGPELIELTENFGLSMPKAQSLEAIYRPRPSMNSFVSQL